MLVLPISSSLYKTFESFAQTKRTVFISGLPGTGKSLLLQQLALIARGAGRTIHLLQWNAARQAFESAEMQAKYPEVNGVTHPAVRKAMGVWARTAVQRWHENQPEPEHLLIGELPLIGNRLIELTQVQEDAAETLLASEQTQFFVPVPSWEVREVIEAARARTIAHPQHSREQLDAPPNVLRALWEEVNGLARQMGLTKANPATPYNPYIYGGVYQALLKHRHHHLELIEEVLRPRQSVYELEVVTNELRADAAEAARIIGLVEETYSPEALEAEVANWHAAVTQNGRKQEPGPELRLPLPQALHEAVGETELSPEQKDALRALLALPLDAGAAEVVPAIDQALEALALAGETVSAAVPKFDIYDSYFNVTRKEGSGAVFIAGLLQAYRNVLENLGEAHSLTVVEIPMLRISLETTLRLFGV